MKALKVRAKSVVKLTGGDVDTTFTFPAGQDAGDAIKDLIAHYLAVNNGIARQDLIKFVEGR